MLLTPYLRQELGLVSPRSLQLSQSLIFVITGHASWSLYTHESLVLDTIISFFLINFFRVQLLYNVVLISGVQQSESVICIPISTLF